MTQALASNFFLWCKNGGAIAKIVVAKKGSTIIYFVVFLIPPLQKQ
jgi:hypothetical protein